MNENIEQAESPEQSDAIVVQSSSNYPASEREIPAEEQLGENESTTEETSHLRARNRPVLGNK